MSGKRQYTWSVVWSPPAHKKYIVAEDLWQSRLKSILEKNCSKLFLVVETGKNGSNLHYDITAEFKAEQGTPSIRTKLKNLIKIQSKDSKTHEFLLEPSDFQQPALKISRLQEEQINIRAGGYGSKENGKIISSIGFTEEELAKGKEQYDILKELKEQRTEIKQIGAKWTLTTIKGYIDKNFLQPSSREELLEIIRKMTAEGYYFDANARFKYRTLQFLTQYYCEKAYNVENELLSEWDLGHDIGGTFKSTYS